MRIKPSVGSVVGQTSDTQWGQILLTPQMYGVIEIEDSAGLARQIGISVLTQLAQSLAEGEFGLREVDRVATAAMSPGAVSVVLIVPVGKVLYVTVKGEGAVYLKRGEKISPLLSKVGALSGEVQFGDILLLVTRSFTQAFNQEELTGIFDHLNPTEAAEKLTLLLHEKSAGFGAAALIFQVSELVPTETEESSPASPIEPEPRQKIFQRGRNFGVSLLRRSLPRTWRAHLSPVKRLISRLFFGENKIVGVVALIFCLLFIVSVVLGIRRQLTTRQASQTTQTLSLAQHAFDEGVALLSLSPLQGREKLQEAKQLIEPLLKTVSPRSKEGRDLASFYQKINENLTQALQIFKETPQLFFDATLLKKGATISGLDISDDTLALLDGATNSVYTLTVADKKSQVVGGGDSFQEGIAAAINGDKLYVLTANGINLVNLTDQKTTPQLIKKDAQWGTVKSLVAYGGNLYLLDTAKSRIWKYVATDNSLPAGSRGFSELREYLNPDSFPNFSQANNLAIDGSVWVATKDGKILRFTQGKDNPFTAQGVELVFGQNLMLYLNDGTKNIYVLDPQNKRVVVLDKDGNYLAEYVWEENFSPTALVVSETQKKILLLADGKLYTLDLR